MQPLPSPSLAGLPLTGSTSLEAVNEAGSFVTTAAALGVLTPVPGASGLPARQQATFQVVAGFADATCVSLRATDGRFLRHSSWRLRLSPRTAPSCSGATRPSACGRRPRTDRSSWRSRNYPGWFVHRRGTELWVDHADGSAAFLADSSFRVRPPLA